MGYVKGNDGIARTVKNPLEGSVGDIDLDDIKSNTVSSTGNVTGGNITTSGNVFFSNGSKFGSAAWTLVETFANVNTYTTGNSSVTMTQTFNYYSSNYNEFMIKLYPLALNAYQKTITFTNMPLSAITAGDKINIGTSWDPPPAGTLDYSYVTWANLSATGMVIHNQYTGAGNNPSTNLYIYAR